MSSAPFFPPTWNITTSYSTHYSPSIFRSIKSSLFPLLILPLPMPFVPFPVVHAVLGHPPPSRKPPRREVLSPYGRRRVNESPDAHFYLAPQLSPCVDISFQEALRALLSDIISGPRVFDLGAGAHSYFPTGPRSFAEGVGLNAKEMAVNKALTTFIRRDLNAHPQRMLPVHTQYFDAVVCNATMPYLVHPEEVFWEMKRILKPAGVIVVSFTDKYVLDKTTRAWRDADPEERLRIVQQCILMPNPGAFDIVQVIKPKDEENTFVDVGKDPFYAVVAKLRRKRRSF